MKNINKKHALIAAAVTAVICVTAFSCYNSRKNYLQIVAVTGATPIAVKADVKQGMSLEVSGYTERVYKFSASALNAFAPVYLRTREVSAAGKFEGTYRYSGIPVLHILEGVAPKKPENAPFDRPLDMVVTFVSSEGKQSHFSFGELTMTDDSNPVILAYAREELLPSKPKESYEWNIHKGNVKGLRLVCPAEKDTARYLDDVVKIVFREIEVDNSILPVTQKGHKCSSGSVKIVDGKRVAPLNLAGVKTATLKDWVRTGHGQGFKGISTAKGYDLTDVLMRNFPGAGPDSYFLFVACDGYRTLFSGREIFTTEAGEAMMLITDVDGKKLPTGTSMGPVKDYYVDRETWGMTHIVKINSIGDIK